MKRDLAMAFSRVTEGAALAGYKWLGRGDKNCRRWCCGRSDAHPAQPNGDQR